MIPPEQDGDFVAAMEDVLEIYRRAWNEQIPVVCMDEQPVQLVEETRTPIPMKRGRSKRYDHEYRRTGVANIFMFTEPLAGWRKISIRDRKTKRDWAEEIHHLLTVAYPAADKVILVCDNLNTHKIGSLYDTYPPDIARDLAERLEIHFTPKHGSWLNIAECELSVFTRQCLGKRAGSRISLRRRSNSWTQDRNERQVGTDWHFTTQDARIKLKRLYPKVKME